ncbi:MAG: ABC transporter ATP-binding protein [Haloarculaceae archaeon]
MSGVEIENVRKTYGDIVAVDDVSLSIEDGELLCLLGPSGCGKTTTLRCIGGLETPTEGRIYLGDDDVTAEPPYRRDTSIVFQNWALFPYKTVLENVAFGLKMAGVDQAERRERAREMLETMQLQAYEDHKPNELSGGQQQRVALARSLVVDPAVLLLDEPLSNLDKRLREEMQIEIGDIHDDLNKTFIYVTHDQDEAFTLADRIGIMNDGSLIQVGEPEEVYENPKNQFVEEFLGDTNFVQGDVTETSANDVVVATALGTDVELTLTGEAGPDVGDSVTIALRPQTLEVGRETAGDGSGGPLSAERERGRLTGRVEDVLYRGSTVRYYVSIDETDLFVERMATGRDDVTEGAEVEVSWAFSDMLCFDDRGNRLEFES